MESCRGVSSALQRTRYISWCLDPAESQTPVTPALTAAASSQETSHQNHQTAHSASVPLLLLSPPETNTIFSHQHSQPTLTDKKHQHTFRPSHHSQDNSWDREDREDRGDRGDPSMLHPRDKSFLLPRSSPVMCRHHRPISWHGGGSDAPESSSSDSPSPGPGSLSPDQRERETATSAEDLGSTPSSGHHSSKTKKDQKPRSASATSNLQRFLHAALHLPFSGQQGLAEERRGRSHTSFAPGSSGGSASKHLPESSADIFKTSCELEKENAHFVVVDMVLMVLEGVKSTQSFNQWTTTTSGASTHTCCDLTPEDNTHRLSDEDEDTSNSSYTDTHQHTQDEEEEEEEDETVRHQPKTLSVLSTDSGFEDFRTEATLTHADSLRDAESLAQQLVLEFKRRWLPSHELQRGRLSLRSSLQELPGTGAVTGSSGSLTEEIRLRTRMRGSLSWAPPRFQIIFTVQPNHRRSEVVALQHFLCAGCGTEVEPKYIKKLRYCEYLGRYFCDCCHSGAEAVIPARVLSCWDFSRHPVSDFSKQLLDSVWHQPLFNLTSVGKTLYSKVKELDKFRELQDQLLSINKLLSACRLSERVMAECAQLPAHLMKQPHLFSMDDLLRVKKGQLVVQAKAVLHAAIAHVEKCELCLGRGFICEFCREKDVIFPFQTDKCRRCPACRACFHKNCFVEKKCPKCARIRSRKNTHMNP